MTGEEKDKWKEDKGQEGALKTSLEDTGDHDLSRKYCFKSLNLTGLSIKNLYVQTDI